MPFMIFWKLKGHSIKLQLPDIKLGDHGENKLNKVTSKLKEISVGLGEILLRLNTTVPMMHLKSSIH